ncbi:MAG: hypothetical protein K9L82_12585 [Chromatiaceae bacterium]|nr:hypothetical protein [Lamprobacter modestohalophilus]MCF7978830.1 hypothetical protein [Chromatiaceae bacterium]MCF7997085.1 hypothetical protein [Chromatiaceae bacterium]MCF8016554.1 hypothetical protein [Chromatiaceae bacterium]
MNLQGFFETEARRMDAHRDNHQDHHLEILGSDYEQSAYYQSLIEISVSRITRYTSAIIRPHPHLDFGCSPMALTTLLGEPELNIYTLNEHLLFYRSETAGYKQRLEFHFHKSRLFYVKRTFSKLSFTDANEVFCALRAKYLDDRLFDPEHEKILDPQGNEIFARDNDELQLEYLQAHHLTFGKL